MSPNPGGNHQITDSNPLPTKRSPSFQDEPELEERISLIRQKFKEMYEQEDQIIVRSPGRAEIIGNHTDYNNGFALASAISRSTIALFRKQDTGLIRIFSHGFAEEPVVFKMDNILKDHANSWTNYPRGVVHELLNAGHLIGGADILVDSNVPVSGGVSSSASFELAIALGLLSLYEEDFDPLSVARLCQKAENDFVGTPSGLLDQVAVALGSREQMVLIDFQPEGDAPVSTRLVSASLGRYNAAFVIAVDPTVKRQLGESGYPARRKICEESLPIWTSLLGRQINTLRDISVEEFEKHRHELDNVNRVMRMRVEHVVKENKRVLEAVAALQRNDIAEFGKLLTASGKSALELYELDENTPELTLLVNTGRGLSGVLGMRNMGGGFSAITLALVHNEAIPAFQEQLNCAYQKEFGKNLEFIEFKVTQGAEVVNL